MKEYKEDIKFLIDKIEEIHPNPYLYYDKKLFYKDLEELSNKNISFDEFNYEIRKIVAKLNDPHTNSLYKRSFFWEIKLIENKVYIVFDYRNLDSKYLYKEIKNINGVDVKEIMPFIVNIASSDNKQWQKSRVQDYLLSKSFLKSINVIKNDEYLIELEDGSIIDANKELEKEIKNLIKYFEQKLISDETYYMKYSKCNSPKPNHIEDFFDMAKKNITATSPKNIIVDLRGNTGGRSSYFSSFSKFLKEECNEVNFYTLTDEYVFSAGRWALQEMSELGSTVIGTPTGSYKDAFGEVRKFILPNSGIEFCCSLKYWKYEKDNFIGYTKENIDEIKEYLNEIYEPDYIVEQSIEDYEEEKDLVINKALELINNYSKGGKI